MSRAFSHERDDAPEVQPVIRTRLVPVHVTAARRAQLEAELASTASESERKRILEILDEAQVVEPPEDRTLVSFGASVDVHGDIVGARRFTIVASDETDVAKGRVSETSPVAQALLGAHTGDVVRWRRPAGDVMLTIDAVSYDGVTAVR